MKIQFLAAGVLFLASASHAQLGSRTTTTIISPFGTTTTTTNFPAVQPNIGGVIANQNIYGYSYPGQSQTTITYGNPGYVYPGYAYPAPVYTYPGAVYSGPISPRTQLNPNPPNITVIPLGRTVIGGYPTYGYPAYPSYPAYGYPVPTYPAHGYPAYGYPVYGDGTVITQGGGYGISIGNGGLSINVGKHRSRTSTHVRRR